MSVIDIYAYPDPVLRKKAREVKEIDDDIRKIVKDMGETMYAAQGIGLASIQVGCKQRIVVYDIAQRDGKPSLQVLINPKIISRDDRTITSEEGCLSVIDYKSDVKRSAGVLVEAVDLDGKHLRIEAEDLHAIVLQHELDHLDGILFIDRISSLKREMYKRKIKKMSRNNG